MFKLSPSSRRKERVWKILKNCNPELTRDKFDGAYESIDNMLKIQSEIQKVIEK